MPVELGGTVELAALAPSPGPPAALSLCRKRLKILPSSCHIPSHSPPLLLIMQCSVYLVNPFGLNASFGPAPARNEDINIDLYLKCLTRLHMKRLTCLLNSKGQ